MVGEAGEHTGDGQHVKTQAGAVDTVWKEDVAVRRHQVPVPQGN